MFIEFSEMLVNFQFVSCITKSIEVEREDDAGNKINGWWITIHSYPNSKGLKEFFNTKNEAEKRYDEIKKLLEKNQE